MIPGEILITVLCLLPLCTSFPADGDFLRYPEDAGQDGSDTPGFHDGAHQPYDNPEKLKFGSEAGYGDQRVDVLSNGNAYQTPERDEKVEPSWRDQYGKSINGDPSLVPEQPADGIYHGQLQDSSPGLGEFEDVGANDGYVYEMPATGNENSVQLSNDNYQSTLHYSPGSESNPEEADVLSEVPNSSEGFRSEQSSPANLTEQYESNAFPNDGNAFPPGTDFNQDTATHDGGYTPNSYPFSNLVQNPDETGFDQDDALAKIQDLIQNPTKTSFDSDDTATQIHDGGYALDSSPASNSQQDPIETVDQGPVAAAGVENLPNSYPTSISGLGTAETHAGLDAALETRNGESTLYSHPSDISEQGPLGTVFDPNAAPLGVPAGGGALNPYSTGKSLKNQPEFVTTALDTFENPSPLGDTRDMVDGHMHPGEESYTNAQWQPVEDTAPLSDTVLPQRDEAETSDSFGEDPANSRYGEDPVEEDAQVGSEVIDDSDETPTSVADTSGNVTTGSIQNNMTKEEESYLDEQRVLEEENMFETVVDNSSESPHDANPADAGDEKTYSSEMTSSVEEGNSRTTDATEDEETWTKSPSEDEVTDSYRHAGETYGAGVEEDTDEESATESAIHEVTDAYSETDSFDENGDEYDDDNKEDEDVHVDEDEEEEEDATASSVEDDDDEDDVTPQPYENNVIEDEVEDEPATSETSPLEEVTQPNEEVESWTSDEVVTKGYEEDDRVYDDDEDVEELEEEFGEDLEEEEFENSFRVDLSNRDEQPVNEVDSEPYHRPILPMVLLLLIVIIMLVFCTRLPSYCYSTVMAFRNCDRDRFFLSRKWGQKGYAVLPMGDKSV